MDLLNKKLLVEIATGMKLKELLPKGGGGASVGRKPIRKDSSFVRAYSQSPSKRYRRESAYRDPERGGSLSGRVVFNLM